jgi:outer membrane receptor for ferrienterochelin and colicin
MNLKLLKFFFIDKFSLFFECIAFYCLAAITALVCAFVLLTLTPVCSARDDTKDLTELSIDELMNVPVYGASKYEQKMSKAPAFVTIVTRDEIKKYGYRNLADILRSLSTFLITYDRNYTYAGVRGFGLPGDYNSRILVLRTNYCQMT